jgi:hypothetical protein
MDRNQNAACERQAQFLHGGYSTDSLNFHRVGGSRKGSRSRLRFSGCGCNNLLFHRAPCVSRSYGVPAEISHESAAVMQRIYQALRLLARNRGFMAINRRQTLRSWHSDCETYAGAFESRCTRCRLHGLDRTYRQCMKKRTDVSIVSKASIR